MSAVALHRRLENNAGLLIFGILFVSAIGGLVQVLPSVFDASLVAPTAATKPYPALALAGRDIYIREGCATCHSQQVRPLLAEVRRYGPYSRAGESAYDRPFLMIEAERFEIVDHLHQSAAVVTTSGNRTGESLVILPHWSELVIHSEVVVAPRLQKLSVWELASKTSVAVSVQRAHCH